MDVAELERKAQAGDVRAQVRLAEWLDSQGRSTDSLNWLARAAQGGDAEALALVGLRLLLADRAPHRPEQALGLLDDAAKAGHAASAEVLAVLAGGGFHGPQSWTAALGYLERAAELGSAAAQTQLRILAGEPDADGGPEDWARLRRTVDIAAWTCAPAPRVLSQAPRVGAVDRLAPPEACAWIVEQARGRLQRAEVFDPETGLTIMGSTRTNKVANFGLAETNLLNLLIQARISAALDVPIPMMEAFAVLHYGPGEEASEHFDYLDPEVPSYRAQIAQHGQRIATCLLYLNDGYEGGETAFPELGISHKGGQGDALFFFSVDASGRPDPRTVHAGRPPSSGEKWVLSQFVRDKARVG